MRDCKDRKLEKSVWEIQHKKHKSIVYLTQETKARQPRVFRYKETIKHTLSSLTSPSTQTSDIILQLTTVDAASSFVPSSAS